MNTMTQIDTMKNISGKNVKAKILYNQVKVVVDSVCTFLASPHSASSLS